MLDQCVRDLHGTQIRIQSKPFAEAQNRALGTKRRLCTVPLRSADRAEEYAVRFPADRERVLGERCAVFIVCRAARVARLIRQPECEFRVDGAQNAHGFLRDLLSDAVAGNDCNLIRHDGSPHSRGCSSKGRPPAQSPARSPAADARETYRPS